MSPINKFKKTRSLNSLQTTDHNSQESINPTKDWQNALRACKAQDPEECGFLSQKKFLTILSQNIREVRDYLGFSFSHLNHRKYPRKKYKTLSELIELVEMILIIDLSFEQN